MFKTLYHLKSKVSRAALPKTLMTQAPRRFFSSPPVQTGPGLGAMALLGMGTAGLMYLSYYSYQQRQDMMRLSLQQPQMHMMHPVVQDRIRKTLMYFGGGLATTGFLVAAFRNSLFAINHPFLLFAASLGCMFGTMFTDYHNNYMLKHLFWGGFMAATGLGMVPLIQMASMPIIYDALFATGITVGGLGLVAYNAPSEQFLMWGGALGMGCAGMLGIGLASMFWPSPALYNFWLYGGLVLFSAFVLYDTQKIIHRAKTAHKYDPIGQSLGIYLDTIILFERFLIIFMQNKKK